jgi:hypothetical protein
VHKSRCRNTGEERGAAKDRKTTVGGLMSREVPKKRHRDRIPAGFGSTFRVGKWLFHVTFLHLETRVVPASQSLGRCRSHSHSYCNSAYEGDEVYSHPRGAIHQLLSIVLKLRILVLLPVSTLPYIVKVKNQPTIGE